MPAAPPEEHALITLIADAERAGRREEALHLAEEKQALARRRLGVTDRGFTSREGAAILPGVEPEPSPKIPTDTRRGPWLATYPTGTPFYPADPRVEDIHIEDIAQALSHICRYGGHVPTHYSGAQHSVLVSLLCEREAGRPEARWGLLHDAAEAYLGDLIWPLKQVPELAAPFARLEERILRLVAERFDLEWPMPEAVKWADLSIRAAEARDLLGDPEWARKDYYPPAANAEVKPWISGLARHKFQLRWEEVWEDS